jgi:hypothetical protein
VNVCGVSLDPVDVVAYLGMFAVGVVTGFLIDITRGRDR